MPSEPNFDDFDLENSSESGIDGFEAFDEIGKTSEEIPRVDDGPVVGNESDDPSEPSNAPLDGDEAPIGEAASESEMEDLELAEAAAAGAGAAVATDDADAEETEDVPKKRKFPKLSVFEVMLILSFLFITIATIKLFFALNMYGDFPGSFPWKTSGT